MRRAIGRFRAVSVSIALAIIVVASSCNLRSSVDTSDVASIPPSSTSEAPATLAPGSGADATGPAEAVVPTSRAGDGAPEATPPLAEPITPVASVADVAPIIDDLLAAVPAHVAVVIERANGDVLFDHARETLFDAASLYKLGIMVEVYRQRESGLLRFSDEITLLPGYFLEEDEVYDPDIDTGESVTVGSLLRTMITLSSNVAATALLATVGTDQVNATLSELGLFDTEIRWSPSARVPGAGTAGTASGDVARWPLGERLAATASTLTSVTGTKRFPGAAIRLEDATNVTTAGDMARLFQLLLAGTVVTHAASAEMLGLLADQQINDRLPAGLPPDTIVAHKTGNLDDVVHDAGVVYAPHGPIIVVVLSDEVEDEDSVVRFMQQVARIAFGVMS